MTRMHWLLSAIHLAIYALCLWPRRPLPAKAPEPLTIERGDWLFLFGPDKLESLADIGARVRAGQLGGEHDGESQEVGR